MKFDKKLLLGVFGASERGKTQTLSKLIDKFESDKSYSIPFELKVSELSSSDEIAIFEKSGIKIGISTEGDYQEIVDKTVRKLINYGCDLIVTATRTKGETTNLINQLADKYCYEMQWFEKNTNINEWCNKWPHKGEDFEKRKIEYFNKLNETDAQFLFDYIDPLTQ